MGGVEAVGLGAGDRCRVAVSAVVTAFVAAAIATFATVPALATFASALTFGAGFVVAVAVLAFAVSTGFDAAFLAR